MLQWLSQRFRNEEHDPEYELTTLLILTLKFNPVLTTAKELEYTDNIDRICRASIDSGNRIIIMDHLRSAFSSTDWHTILNALRVLNGLIDSGSSKIFSEVAQGRHFDIVQRTLFLTSYTNNDDRVGKLIRCAAREIREKLLIKMTEIHDIPEEVTSGVSYKDTIEANYESSVSHLVSLKHTEFDDVESLL